MQRTVSRREDLRADVAEDADDQSADDRAQQDGAGARPEAPFDDRYQPHRRDGRETAEDAEQQEGRKIDRQNRGDRADIDRDMLDAEPSCRKVRHERGGHDGGGQHH